MDDLHFIKPFNHTENREYMQFKNIPKSQVQNIDGNKVEKWFSMYIVTIVLYIGMQLYQLTCTM